MTTPDPITPGEDEGDWCDHPIVSVISDVNGDHFCAVCNAEWWEDPL